MSDFAIRAEGLSKQYRIGEKKAAYKTLRETVTDLAESTWNRFRVGRDGRSSADSRIWALRDVSFEVKPGDVVGVIGRNGAGKSTLLKVLSRITEPTEGRAVIRGRVGSLLEVGTGFHPELTGRENMYLNGAILGMRRREMDRKLDAIVAFAEIEKFIDTPVKFYSSGMYLRLAFSVAAHLETEILLVDEVLAVGDLRFQKRCLGKMESVAAEGRTVLFVSHNLGAIKDMCRSAVLLHDGSVSYRGSVVEALSRYTGTLRQTSELQSRDTNWSSISINGQSEAGLDAEPIYSAKPFFVDVTLEARHDYSKVRLYCLIDNSAGEHLLHHHVSEELVGTEGLPVGRHRLRITFPPLWVVPDVYTLYFKLIARRASGGDEYRLSERVLLNVLDDSGQAVGRVKAIMIPPLSWSIVPTEETEEKEKAPEETDASRAEEGLS
jgi:lipopolysaccharide transport system ATP-binding protein